jgi:hypothetical protein
MLEAGFFRRAIIFRVQTYSVVQVRRGFAFLTIGCLFVATHALPRAVAPLAKKWNDIRTGVIFAEDLQRLISRRRSFMIEVVDAFSPGDHGEGFVNITDV